MSVKNLMLAVAAAALMSSPVAAAVQIVNNPALFGGTLQVITFDTPDSDTIAEVQANYGVILHSLNPDAHTFEPDQVISPGSARSRATPSAAPSTA